jgi:hypothetical protein
MAEFAENPQPLGLKKSFGFGDRLGLATPGHIAAVKKTDFAPIFAQQSIREMTRTDRTPEQVMTAAKDALKAEGWTQAWGADADHLKTPEDARRTFDAGFCFFTIDPSDFVVNSADEMSLESLREIEGVYTREGVFPEGGAMHLYYNRNYHVEEDTTLSFDEGEVLRPAVKYGKAIAHTERMAKAIAEICGDTPHEIEVSVDETDSPTTVNEHLFFGLELKRRGVQVVSLAPRFVGDFEKGIDYKGDLSEFEHSLKQHVAVARFCGPYKLSIHSGSDKFSIYPAIGRQCGDLLHVKTAGTSYLEALRVILHRDRALFQEILCYAAGRFDEDRKSYHISATAEGVRQLKNADDADLEKACFDEVTGRQLLHVTFGSVLTIGEDSNGKSLKPRVMEALRKNQELYDEFLERHFDKHLSLLNAG